MHGSGGPSSRPEAVAAADGHLVAEGAGMEEEEPGHARSSQLFGRDLLYVGVLSLQLVTATVVSPVLAHVLPGAEFGHLSSAIALHQVLVVLALIGLDQAMILIRAETGSDHTARTLVGVGLLVALGLTGLAYVSRSTWGPALGFPTDAPIVGIVVGWTPLAAGVFMVSALLLSQDRLTAFATVNVLAALGGQAAGLIVLFVGDERTASGYATGNLVTLTLTLLLGLVLVRPRLPRRVELQVTRRAVRLGLPLMVSGLAVFVLNASDRLVIQRLLGPEEAGRYQIAYVVGNLAVLLIGMIDGAFLPRIAAVREDRARWVVIGLARSGLLKLMSPVILGVTLAAPLVLTVVAPSDFRPAELHPVVYLVALAGLPVLLGVGWVWELMTRKRTRGLAASAIVAALANVVVNLVLVPTWGLVGAAAATVAAFAVESLGYRIALPRGVALPRIPRSLVLGVLAAAAVSAGTLWLPHTLTWNAVRFGLAVACLPWLLHQLRSARARLERGVAAATTGGETVDAPDG
ncbi:MAG TPA: lipopolysaccharide biosynthesis protein [Geodermatophilus sp.]|nr:lipopolysaccharide biosynthesis protein [Geodermatophilus sp.]